MLLGFIPGARSKGFWQIYMALQIRNSSCKCGLFKQLLP